MIFSKRILKAMTVSLTLMLATFIVFVSLESSTAYASVSASDTVVVTLNVTTGIAISDDVANATTMSTALGVSSDTAIGTTTWTVKTNNALGYVLTLAATNTPAMKSGSNTITDYSTTTAPSLWSVSAGTARFGFSVNGADVSTAVWGTGSQCAAAANVPSASLKYYGFYTTATSVATRSSTTTNAGTPTVVCYAVQQNGIYIPSGTYQATIVATATTL